RLRVYAGNVNPDEIFQAILADLPNQPGLHQLSISFGFPESTDSRDYAAMQSQVMAAFASAGVSVFASSGDRGVFDGAGNRQPSIPASVPHVTGVGGTSLFLDFS